MTSSGLTEFLMARIAEDEATAIAVRDIGADQWSINGMHRSPDPHALVTYQTGDYRSLLAHQFNPARVLADCDMKRLIMSIHSAYAPTGDPVYSPDWSLADWCIGCSYTSNEERVTEHIDDCPILRALALPFTDHPDFRGEWNSARQLDAAWAAAHQPDSARLFSGRWPRRRRNWPPSGESRHRYRRCPDAPPP